MTVESLLHAVASADGSLIDVCWVGLGWAGLGCAVMSGCVMSFHVMVCIVSSYICYGLHASHIAYPLSFCMTADSSISYNPMHQTLRSTSSLHDVDTYICICHGLHAFLIRYSVLFCITADRFSVMVSTHITVLYSLFLCRTAASSLSVKDPKP